MGNITNLGDRIVDKRRGWESRVEMDILLRPKEEISTYAKLIYVALCGFANKKSTAFPSVDTLAGAASCSTRQVFRALDILEKRGLVARNMQVKPGKGKCTTLYEIRGSENYVPPDPCDCGSYGVDVTDSVTDSHMGHDCQSRLYIRSIEQLQDNIIYPPSEGQAELATSPAKIENEPDPEPELKPKALGPKADERIVSPEPHLYPASEAPQAMKQTAEYLLLKTGREGLTEEEISALRELNASQYPAAVQREIDTAVERFRRLGRDLATLSFGYVASSMQHRHTRPLTRARPSSGKSKEKSHSGPKGPDAPQIVNGLLVGNWLDDV